MKFGFSAFYNLDASCIFLGYFFEIDIEMISTKLCNSQWKSIWNLPLITDYLPSPANFRDYYSKH